MQLVASSLVCLPAVDAGGAGPKAESWAFGTDVEGLRILVNAGVFGVRACKLCNDGIVVQVHRNLAPPAFCPPRQNSVLRSSHSLA